MADNADANPAGSAGNNDNDNSATTNNENNENDNATTSPPATSSSTSYSLSASELRQRGVPVRDTVSKPSPMATDNPEQAAETSSSQNTNLGMFECNICLETASNPVVTMCGHIYCWPCVHEWMSSDRSAARTCPVCKSAIDRERCIPIYGRGADSSSDPRSSTLPKRPQGHRTEPPPQQQQQRPFSTGGWFGGSMNGLGGPNSGGGYQYNQTNISVGFPFLPFFGFNIVYHHFIT